MADKPVHKCVRCGHVTDPELSAFVIVPDTEFDSENCGYFCPTCEDGSYGDDEIEMEDFEPQHEVKNGGL